MHINILHTSKNLYKPCFVAHAEATRASTNMWQVDLQVDYTSTMLKYIVMKEPM